MLSHKRTPGGDGREVVKRRIIESDDEDSVDSVHSHESEESDGYMPSDTENTTDPNNECENNGVITIEDDEIQPDQVFEQKNEFTSRMVALDAHCIRKEHGQLRVTYGTVEPTRSQKQFIEWAVEKCKIEKGLINGNPMGTGKTLSTSMAIIEYWHRQGRSFSDIRILVTCPVSLIDNWKEEWNRIVPREMIQVCYYEKSAAQNVAMMRASCPVTIVPYSQLAIAVVNRYFCEKIDPRTGHTRVFDFMVLDEIHIFRNGYKTDLETKPCLVGKQALRAEQCNKTAASVSFNAVARVPATVRIGLTGTPQQNNLSDLCSICCMLRVPGYDKLSLWRTHCGSDIEVTTNAWLQQLKTRVFIRQQMPDMPMLKRRQRMVQISDKEHRVVRLLAVKLEETARKLEQLKRSAGLNSARKEDAGKLSKNMLSELSYMRQFVISPEIMIMRELEKKHPDHDTIARWKMLHAEAGNGPSTLVRAVVEQLHVCLFSANSKTHKIVIFCEFVTAFTVLEKYIRELLPAYTAPLLWLTGKDQPKTRAHTLNRFNVEPETRIMFVSSGVGDVGLNLQVANTYIQIHAQYNSLQEEQQRARVWRLGQTRSVYQYNFTVAKTVDEWIYILGTHKRNMAEKLVNDKSVITGSREGTSVSAESNQLTARVIDKANIEKLFKQFVKFGPNITETAVSAMQTSRKKLRLARRAARIRRITSAEHAPPKRGRVSLRQLTHGESSDEYEAPISSDISSDEEKMQHLYRDAKKRHENEINGDLFDSEGVSALGKQSAVQASTTILVLVGEDDRGIPRFVAVPCKSVSMFKDDPERMRKFALQYEAEAKNEASLNQMLQAVHRFGTPSRSTSDSAAARLLPFDDSDSDSITEPPDVHPATGGLPMPKGLQPLGSGATIQKPWTQAPMPAPKKVIAVKNGKLCGMPSSQVNNHERNKKVTDVSVLCEKVQISDANKRVLAEVKENAIFPTFVPDIQAWQIQAHRRIQELPGLTALTQKTLPQIIVDLSKSQPSPEDVKQIVSIFNSTVRQNLAVCNQYSDKLIYCYIINFMPYIPRRA